MISQCEWTFPHDSPHLRKNWYHPDTIAHPAKMSVSLCQQILISYVSNPYSIILDPMAGIGTTAIEGMRIHPHATFYCLEYEHTFCQMMAQNVRQVHYHRCYLRRQVEMCVVLGFKFVPCPEHGTDCPLGLATHRRRLDKPSFWARYYMDKYGENSVYGRAFKHEHILVFRT